MEKNPAKFVITVAWVSDKRIWVNLKLQQIIVLHIAFDTFDIIKSMIIIYMRSAPSRESNNIYKIKIFLFTMLVGVGFYLFSIHFI